MIKKILIGLIVLFFVLIAGIVAVPFLFKDKIFEFVKTEINKNVTAQVDFGDFDLTLIKNFPNLTITITDFKIVGIQDFDGDTLADIGEFVATLDIMNVIKGEQISIKTIKINNSKILLKVLSDGKANWDIAPVDSSAVTAPTPEPSKFKASLKNYELNNAAIIYDDATFPCYISLNGLDHSGEGDFTQDLFLLKTQSSIKELSVTYDGIRYLKKTNADLKMDLDMDMPKFKFTFKDNELQLNELFLGFNGYFAMPDTNMDMDITFFTKKTEFKSLLSMIPSAYTADFADVKTSGNLTLDGFVKGTYNAISMPSFGLKVLIENANFKYPDLPAGMNNIFADIKIINPDGIDDHTVIDIPRFHLEFDKEPFDAKLTIKTPVSDPEIDALIKGRIDIDQVTKVFPLEEGMKVSGIINADVSLKGRLSSIEQEKYEEFNVNGQVDIDKLIYESPDMAQSTKINNAQLKFNPRNLNLTAFDCQIGKSDIQANGSFENYLAYVLKDDVIKGNMNLSSSLFDANEFLAEDQSTSTGTAAETDTASLTVIEIPANVDFALNVQFKKIFYEDKVIENLKGQIKVNDKTALMNNLSLNILEGAVEVNGLYGTQDITKPEIKFDLNVQNVDIQKSFKTFVTVQKLAPIAEYTAGKVSVNFDIKGFLQKDMMPDFNSLNGGGELFIPHAEIKDYKPITMMATTLKIKELEKMELNNLKASFTIENGRSHVRPFEIKQGDKKMLVSGSTGFDQTIDYLIKAEIPRKEFGAEANALVNNLLSLVNQKGANLSIEDIVKFNIKIGGTVTNPTVKTDFADIAANLKEDLKGKAKEEFDKRKKEAEEKVRQEAERLKKEAEDRARQEADKLKQQAEQKKKELEDKARQEAERLKKEAEDKAKQAAEKVKKEAEEKAKKEAEKKLKNLLKKP